MNADGSSFAFHCQGSRCMLTRMQLIVVSKSSDFLSLTRLLTVVFHPPRTSIAILTCCASQHVTASSTSRCLHHTWSRSRVRSSTGRAVPLYGQYWLVCRLGEPATLHTPYQTHVPSPVRAEDVPPPVSSAIVVCARDCGARRKNQVSNCCSV